MAEALAVPQELVDAELAAMLERYRAEPEHARRVLLEVLDRDVALAKELAKLERKGRPVAQVARTRAWKQAVSRARKRLYSELRRYVAREVDLGTLSKELAVAVETGDAVAREQVRQRILEGHASTRERIGGSRDFEEALLAELDGVGSIVDLGCGVHPLMFPFARLPSLQRYLALDRDPGCIQSCAAWAEVVSPGVLDARRWSLQDGCASLAADAGLGDDGVFDVALMLKFLPVLARQHRNELPLLSALPVRRWIVTGSAVALAKHEDIGRREGRVIQRALEELGLRVERRWQAGEEIAFVAVPPS